MKTLQRDGTTLHYWMHGDSHKPVVVFIHGATADHRMFDAQIDAFAARYRVLTWDVRGHGRSQPLGERFTLRAAMADLLAILDQEGIERVVLIGQSMGGNLSQEIVFRHPQRVLALVAVDCTCNTAPLSALERWALAITEPTLRLYPTALLRRQIADISSTKPTVRAYLRETMAHLSSAAIARVLGATADLLHPEPDYRVPVPLLLVIGAHDRLGNIAAAMPAWAARDHARLITIPNAGHMSNQDQPDIFNRVVLEFIETL